MRSDFDGEIRKDSAPVQDTDTTEYHIRELTAALAAEVPDGFTARVMGEIRAERRRIALRHRILRYGSAVVAALIIVPVAAIMVPAMIRGENKADALPSVQDALVYEAVVEGSDNILYNSDPAAGDSRSTDVPTNGTVNEIDSSAKSAPVEETEEVLCTTTYAAPEHMSRPTDSSPATLGTTADTLAADTKYTLNVLTEPTAITALRAVIGKEKMNAYLSKSDTIDGDTAQAIIRTYGVTREAFLAAAADLNLSFTQDELSELFETPLTEE